MFPLFLWSKLALLQPTSELGQHAGTPTLSTTQRTAPTYNQNYAFPNKLSAIPEENDDLAASSDTTSSRGVYNINYDELDPEEDLNADYSDRSDTASVRSSEDGNDASDVDLPKSADTTTEHNTTLTPTTATTTRHKDTKDSPTTGRSSESAEGTPNNNATTNKTDNSNNVDTTDEVPLALIVDDNPINVKVLQHHLTSTGFKTRSVVNGEDAVTEAASTLFDIVFLDVCILTFLEWYYFKQKTNGSRARTLLTWKMR